MWGCPHLCGRRGADGAARASAARCRSTVAALSGLNSAEIRARRCGLLVSYRPLAHAGFPTRESPKSRAPG